MRKQVVLVLGLIISGCATSRPAQTSGVAADAGSEVAGYLSQIDEILAALMSRPSMSEKPDCAHACSLQIAVCDLADRICVIAGRHVGDADLGDKCAEGRSRCGQAEADLSSVCTCPTAPAIHPPS
jgi:hypothetical protein